MPPPAQKPPEKEEPKKKKTKKGDYSAVRSDAMGQSLGVPALGAEDDVPISAVGNDDMMTRMKPLPIGGGSGSHGPDKTLQEPLLDPGDSGYLPQYPTV
jgi:hypothetical protein